MDNDSKRRVLRKLSTGVYVLTSRYADRYGAATITWVSQISFRPPLISAALGPQSNVFQCLEKSLVAALHIVGDHQPDIARRFCSPTEAVDGTLNGEPFVTGRTLAPVLSNLPVYIECQVDRLVDTDGDHVLVIMRVVEAQCREDWRPLTIAGLRGYLDGAPAAAE